MATGDLSSNGVLDNAVAAKDSVDNARFSLQRSSFRGSRSSCDSVSAVTTAQKSCNESLETSVPPPKHLDVSPSTPAGSVNSTVCQHLPTTTTTTSTSATGTGGGGSGGGGGATTTNLTRHQSYKDQRRAYCDVKRRATARVLSTLRDPAVEVRCGWLKVRSTLKSWTKVWTVLRPGMLVLYRSEKIAKKGQWTGTVLLPSCQLIERPSKKDGFCFKLFHPLGQSIWSAKGPDGETHTVTGLFPLPADHLICRASSQQDGQCWMDALELGMSVSTLLTRSMQSAAAAATEPPAAAAAAGAESSVVGGDDGETTNDGVRQSLPDHQEDEDSAGDDVYGSCLIAPSSIITTSSGSQLCADAAADDTSRRPDVDADESSVDDDEDEDRLSSGALESEVVMPPETVYVANSEVLCLESGGGGQTEELADDNKSLLWCLLKQLRPGMDLSRVVLPTFILEPRSFLDKLSDHYYHADHLARVVTMDDPYERIKHIVGWYLSGFYKKPKGLKKPYNPILGETFRCYWQHPNGSRTFYIAEQVSHHPPMSAFYVSNRREGFCISCTILAKSKFYGNSTSALLNGRVTLALLPRGELYHMNMPYAHCKGLLVGTLFVEMGGTVEITCASTGYSAELDFKFKPLFSGPEEYNRVSGRIRLGRETLATVDGKWDSLITCRDKRTNECETLWQVTEAVRQSRLVRYTVAPDQQHDCESERLWRHVSHCIGVDDQAGATEHKLKLEEEQRAGARHRLATNTDWHTKHFYLDSETNEYVYRYADMRPWDPHTDLSQYEADYRVLTSTRLRSPLTPPTAAVSGRLSQLTSKLSVQKDESEGCGADTSNRLRKAAASGAAATTTRGGRVCVGDGEDSSSLGSVTDGILHLHHQQLQQQHSPANVTSSGSKQQQQQQQQQGELARIHELLQSLQHTVSANHTQLVTVSRLLQQQQRHLPALQPTSGGGGGVLMWLSLSLVAAMVALLVAPWLR